jgi:hypothetical protein
MRDVERLLGELTEWRRSSGVDPNAAKLEFISTGESNAALNDLKRELDARGVKYEWNEAQQEYRLVSEPET